MNISEEFLNQEIAIEEEVKSSKVKEEITQAMIKNGIPIPVKPSVEQYKKYMYLPDDITSIHNQELGNYLAMYESQAAWLGYLVARKECEVRHAQTLLNFVFNKLVSSSTGTQIQIKKASAEADPYYTQCKLEADEIVSEAAMLKSSLITMERYARVISREITSRKVANDSGLFRGNTMSESDNFGF